MGEKGPLIAGKVAQILSDRELVINCGAEQGVKEGMIFTVLNPKGQNIVDPDTKQELGTVRQEKVRVRVTAVQDKLAVATTYEKVTISSGGIGLSGFASLFEPNRSYQRFKSLNTTDAPWKELSEKDSYVRIGDPVEELREESYK